MFTLLPLSSSAPFFLSVREETESAPDNHFLRRQISAGFLHERPEPETARISSCISPTENHLG